MQIISHRGYWKFDNEKNTLNSFKRSFDLNFGTETDLRDSNGRVCVSHDMPRTSQSILYFEDFLDLYKTYKTNLPLALNIKSDGLQTSIKQILDKFNITNYRLFDMSIPDQKLVHDHGLYFLSRLSDIEPQPIMLNESKGVWLDSFFNLWYDSDIINTYLDLDKEVWIVSPELHNNSNLKLWRNIKSNIDLSNKKLYLCTDFPEHAKEYFYEK